MWHDRVVDAGIDRSIELCDPSTGEVSNHHIQVQSKASDQALPGETDDGFWYLCDEEDSARRRRSVLASVWGEPVTLATTVPPGHECGSGPPAVKVDAAGARRRSGGPL